MTFRHYSHNRKRLPSWVTGDVMTPSSIHDAYLCGEVTLCFSPLVDVSQANLEPMCRCLLTLVPLTTAVKNNRPRVVSLFEGQTWWWCMKTSHSGAVYLTAHCQVTNAHLLKLHHQLSLNSSTTILKLHG